METTQIHSVNETATAIEQNNNNNNNNNDCKNVDFAVDTLQCDDLINGNDNDEFDFDSSDLEDNSDTDVNKAICEIATIKFEQIENVSSTNADDDIDCSKQIQNDMHSIDPLMVDDTSIVSSNGGQLNEKVLEQDQNDEQDGEEEEPIFYYLEKSNEIAEARLAQRRLARAEAREIRMRELERQQKEQEQNADRAFDMQTAAGIDPIVRTRFAMSSATLGSLRSGTMSSRRSSEDSLEEEGRSLRDMKQEIKDVDERYRKAMIANAQLDNERASNTYQIQLLKDKVEEMEETHAQLQREYKDKCRDYETLRRTNEKLMEDLKLVQGQLNERDTLIAEEGLTIVTIENDDGTDAKRALVTNENAQLLDTHQGSLDVRLKKFTEEKATLRTEIDQLHQQLISAKTQRRSGSQNGPIDEDDFEDAQREANKLIADYKYKLTKAEQEIASLQASLARSETQVIRYKSTADAAEKVEAELKIERRKLQRENREMMERLEELETSHNHLLKRLDKLKNAKSTLLKEL